MYSASGACLDVTGDDTANGTEAELYTCTGGAPNQQWRSLGSHQLVSTHLLAAPRADGNRRAALTSYTVTASPGGATATAGPYDTSATVSGLTPAPPTPHRHHFQRPGRVAGVVGDRFLHPRVTRRPGASTRPGTGRASPRPG